MTGTPKSVHETISGILDKLDQLDLTADERIVLSTVLEIARRILQDGGSTGEGRHFEGEFDAAFKSHAAPSSGPSMIVRGGGSFSASADMIVRSGSGAGTSGTSTSDPDESNQGADDDDDKNAG